MSEQTSQVSGLIDKLNERHKKLSDYARSSKVGGAVLLGLNVGLFAYNTPSVLRDIVHDRVDFADGYSLAASTIGALAGAFVLRSGSEYHAQANATLEAIDRAELAQAQAQEQIAAYEQFK